jgi:hypothetical protein
MMAISLEAQTVLLSLARSAIRARLEGTSAPPLPPLGDGARAEVERNVGCFVTLHLHGELRGCVGTFREDTALYRNVREMACAAAFADSRFPPLSQGELAEVRLEISVLGPRRPIEEAREIEIGRHGLWIELRRERGVLLPQVAVEHGFGVEEFLAATCRKARLPAGAWRDPSARVCVFEAEVFGEPTLH